MESQEVAGWPHQRHVVSGFEVHASHPVDPPSIEIGSPQCPHFHMLSVLRGENMAFLTAFQLITEYDGTSARCRRDLVDAAFSFAGVPNTRAPAAPGERKNRRV
jgi:hypothetical protein